MGEMADMHDYGYWPDDDELECEYGGSPRSSRPYCKYCGSRAVTWIHTGARWRLYDEHAKNPHVCKNVASPDEFDVV